MDTERLYSLTMYNEWQEGFFIGLFASRGQAEQVGQEYLRDVPGFRDYPCTCEVTEKRVLGEPGPDHRVYLIWGWDEAPDGREEKIWCSECYTDPIQARAELEAARQRLPRQEWSLDCYQVGQRLWTEGFVRIASRSAGHGED